MTLPATYQQPDLIGLAEIATRSVDSQHSKRCYRRALREFLAWAQAEGVPLDRDSVQAYRERLVESGRGASSVNQTMSAIRLLCREAQARGVLPDGVLAAVLTVRGVKSNGSRAGNWLDAETAHRLMNAPGKDTPKGLRDRALLAILIGTGIRRAECSSLDVEQFQQRSGRWVIVDLMRKRRRVATVPVPEWAYDRLVSWWHAADIIEGAAFRRISGRGAVTADRLSADGVWKVVHRYAHLLELEITPHDLRRTCASLAEAGGATLRTIQQQLGHGSLQTTERYLQNISVLRDAACDKVEPPPV